MCPLSHSSNIRYGHKWVVVRQWVILTAISFAEGQWQYNQLLYLRTRTTGGKQHCAAIQAPNSSSPLETLEMLLMRSLWQKQCAEDAHLNKSASSMLWILTKTVACGGVAPRRNDVTFVANESFRVRQTSWASLKLKSFRCFQYFWSSFRKDD